MQKRHRIPIFKSILHLPLTVNPTLKIVITYFDHLALDLTAITSADLGDLKRAVEMFVGGRFVLKFVDDDKTNDTTILEILLPSEKIPGLVAAINPLLSFPGFFMFDFYSDRNTDQLQRDWDTEEETLAYLAGPASFFYEQIDREFITDQTFLGDECEICKRNTIMSF
jgi:hypothetical protein